jgi:alpha-galactosidase
VARKLKASGSKPDWIALGPAYASNVGDWLQPAEAFRDRMGSVSRGIQESGMVPGVRLAPFLVSRKSRIGREKRDWLARNHHGSLLVVPDYPSGREGAYVLDVTHPEAAAYARKIFSVIRDKWGYRLFVVERIGDAILPGIRRDDRLSGGDLAARAAHLVRQAAGNRVFLLARGVPLLAAPGEWDAQGISATEVSGAGKEFVVQSLTRSEWQGRYWHNFLGTIDPGRRVKPKMAAEEHSKRSAVVISGGMLVIEGDPRDWDDDALRNWNQLHKQFNECRDGSLAVLPPEDFERPIVIRNDKGLIGLFNPFRREHSVSLNRDALKRRLGAAGPLKSDGGMILNSPEIVVTVPSRGSRLFKA